MGRNTWAEQLQALLLSNCTLRYVVLMAVAHMTCYQHLISKTSMVHARFEKQTLRKANRGAALCLSGPWGSLCRGPTLAVSGPGALCVGARRSLCRGPALSMSGPGAPRRSLSGSVSGRSSLFVSGPGALRVGCRGQRSGACQVPAVSCQAPGAHAPVLRAPSSDPAGSAPASPQLRSCKSLSEALIRVPRPGSSSPANPQLRSACHPSCVAGPHPKRDPHAPSTPAKPRATHWPPAQIRVPPIQPAALPFSTKGKVL